MSAHHKFSPSGAARLMACPGSYRMQLGRPEETSEYAAEGTLLHDVVAKLEGSEHSATNCKSVYAGLTAEQERCVEACLEYAKLNTPEGAEVHRELKVRVWHNFDLLTEGTADYVVIVGDRAVLIDWKFGRGAVADPAGNPQLALYACGVAQKFRVSEVECHIFQPRVGDHAPPYVFRDFDAIRERYAAAVEMAEGPGLQLLAGDHCKYCRAAAHCPALAMAANDAVVITKVTPENAAEVHEQIKAAKQWLDAVSKAVKALVLDGNAPGLEIKETRTRVIEDAQAAYNAVAENLTKDEFLALVSVPVGRLEEAIFGKLRAKHGDAMLVKDLRAIAKKLVNEVATRGTPRQSVEVVK